MNVHQQCGVFVIAALHVLFSCVDSKIVYAKGCHDDDSVNCPVWLEHGYCNHSNSIFRDYMKRACQRSCGICTPTSEDEDTSYAYCDDSRANCNKMKPLCSWFPTYLESICPRTCGYCAKLRQANVVDAPIVQCLPITCGLQQLTENTASSDSNSFWDKKILGGKESPRVSWQGLILRKQVGMNGVHYCSATIFCARWLVTAAHCLVASSSHKFEENLSTLTLII